MTSDSSAMLSRTENVSGEHEQRSPVTLLRCRGPPPLVPPTSLGSPLPTTAGRNATIFDRRASVDEIESLYQTSTVARSVTFTTRGTITEPEDDNINDTERTHDRREDDASLGSDLMLRRLPQVLTETHESLPSRVVCTRPQSPTYQVVSGDLDLRGGGRTRTP